ncbi:MAG: biotin--[acetyl-CoA-carboxylase] ligase [Anaerolineae bacterium]
MPQEWWQYPDWLAAAYKRLRHLKVGANLIYRRSTASTNDDARVLAIQGAPDGLIVLADEQTHGRGRLSRSWFAPPETCLLLSVLFRCSIPIARAPQLAMLMSLATLDAVEAVAGLRAELKWPNDFILNGRKVGGILSEVESAGQYLRWAVVGLGLNVNADFSHHPDLADSATSLKSVLGNEVNRGDLLVALVRSLSIRYSRFLKGEEPLTEWQERLGTIGRQVTVQIGDETVCGLADFVTAEGSLFLRLANGSRREIFAGDVKLREAVK